MATILDLLKKNKEELYGGVVGNTFIESRGLLNIPRATALAASSPSSVADLIGNQVSGVLKGSAKRPSDTIFTGNKPFNKPVTLTNLPQDAIEDGKSYFIKKTPAPDSLVARLKQGASSPAGLASNIAANAIKNPKKTRKALRDLSNSLKKQSGIGKPFINAFGTQNSEPTELTSEGWDAGSVLREDRKFSKFAPEYTMDSTLNKFIRTSTIQRDPGKTFDDILSNILLNKIDTKDQKLYKIENENGIQAPYVLISLYPNKSNKILLPATISGLTEDISPEISSFKYIGSPFNSYKYNGVERTIKFNLKLYYTSGAEKLIMVRNLNKLRKLAFPADNVSKVAYNSSGDFEIKEATSYAALAYNPNLIYLTIYGLYKELFGIIDSLSFDIDDNVSWPITDENFDGNSTTPPHPSVINASISMRVLETPVVWKNDEAAEFEYAGDDVTYFTSNNEQDRIDQKSARLTPDATSLQNLITKPYGFGAGARIEQLSRTRPSDYTGAGNIDYDHL